MAIDFPNNPSDGDTHPHNGKTWIWDSAGQSWALQSSSLSVQETDPIFESEKGVIGGVATLDSEGNVVQEVTTSLELDSSGGSILKYQDEDGVLHLIDISHLLSSSESSESVWTTLSDNNIYYTEGNVGIGTNTPQARLHIDVPSGIIDPNVNIPVISAGHLTTATGHASVALGTQAIASGKYSIATGFLAEASGTGSVATGFSSTSSGNFSTAMGSLVHATGDNSFALGELITVSGSNSFGIGLKSGSASQITANNTMAIMGGNVGIGTVAPAEKLEVLGNAKITGKILINGVDEKYTDIDLATVQTDEPVHYFNIDASLSRLFVLDSPISDEIGLKISNLNLAVGSATNLSVVVKQDSSPTLISYIEIDQLEVDIKWQGSNVPSGVAGAMEIFSFTILRENESGYVALSQSIDFG